MWLVPILWQKLVPILWQNRFLPRSQNLSAELCDLIISVGFVQVPEVECRLCDLVTVPILWQKLVSILWQNQVFFLFPRSQKFWVPITWFNCGAEFCGNVGCCPGPRSRVWQNLHQPGGYVLEWAPPRPFYAGRYKEACGVREKSQNLRIIRQGR